MVEVKEGLQVHSPGLYEEAVVKVNRCAKVVKGGRRFSFSALVVVGDRHGSIGIGFGKAKEVPSAVEKAVKDAHKNLVRVKLRKGSIEHAVTGRFGAASVPAGESTVGTSAASTGSGLPSTPVAASGSRIRREAS